MPCQSGNALRDQVLPLETKGGVLLGRPLKNTLSAEEADCSPGTQAGHPFILRRNEGFREDRETMDLDINSKHDAGVSRRVLGG